MIIFDYFDVKESVYTDKTYTSVWGVCHGKFNRYIFWGRPECITIRPAYAINRRILERKKENSRKEKWCSYPRISVKQIHTNLVPANFPQVIEQIEKEFMLRQLKNGEY